MRRRFPKLGGDVAVPPLTHATNAARKHRVAGVVGVLAQAMLTLLGIEGQRCRLDHHLKSNTSKERQHSLLRQGGTRYDSIPNRKQDRLDVLMAAHNEVPNKHGVMRLIAGTAKWLDGSGLGPTSQFRGTHATRLESVPVAV